MDLYTFERLLGEGSHGRVHLATSKKSGAVVALKIISKGSKSVQEQRQVREEFKLQKRLRHPNVLPVFDVFETEAEIVAVTEFAPEGDLHTMMGPERRPVTEERAREIAVDLLAALHYLHNKKILHRKELSEQCGIDGLPLSANYNRDIKPQNVLIDCAGRAKLCDFGFARNLTARTQVCTSIKGTPLYMAPEQIDEQPYDQAADLWSVGCVVYELLLGAPPYHTNNLLKLIQNMRYNAIRWPDNVSDDCRSFLQGLLQKDHQQRMSWSKLKRHPFVREGLEKALKKDTSSSSHATNEDALTASLTASKELAKAMERQEKAKRMPGGSQTLIKLGREAEEKKRRMRGEMESEGGTRRNSDLTGNLQRLAISSQPPRATRRNSMGNIFSQPDAANIRQPEPMANVLSQPATTVETRQLDRRDPLGNILVNQPTPAAEIAEPEKVEPAVDADEWLGFLDSQLEEIVSDVGVLSNQNDVALICTPLRGNAAEPEVVLKVGRALALPFAMDNVPKEDMKRVLRAYLAVGVINTIVEAMDRTKSSAVLAFAAKVLSRLILSEGEGEGFLEQLDASLASKSALVDRLLDMEGTRSDCRAWAQRLLDSGKSIVLAQRVHDRLCLGQCTS